MPFCGRCLRYPSWLNQQIRQARGIRPPARRPTRTPSRALLRAALTALTFRMASLEDRFGLPNLGRAASPGLNRFGLQVRNAGPHPRTIKSQAWRTHLLCRRPRRHGRPPGEIAVTARGHTQPSASYPERSGRRFEGSVLRDIDVAGMQSRWTRHASRGVCSRPRPATCGGIGSAAVRTPGTRNRVP
jgi:hypothetical protein